MYFLYPSASQVIGLNQAAPRSLCAVSCFRSQPLTAKLRLRHGQQTSPNGHVLKKWKNTNVRYLVLLYLLGDDNELAKKVEFMLAFSA